jgi:hypothetical protein
LSLILKLSIMKKIILLLAIGASLTTQTLFAQVPSYVPTNGLVGYWPFNGNANDVSGNGNNGTVNGATLTTDRNGNANSAYSFDGQSYIRVTHNQNFNFGIGNYTLSVWANKNGNNFLNALLTKATPHPATGWTFGFVNNDIRFLAGVQNSNFLSNGSVTYGPINNGEWNNYIAVFNPTSNSIKIYINGQVVVSDVVSTGLINCDNIFDLMFGVGNPNGAPSGPEFFNGFIDDIGIWNRALTQQEITNIYNSSLPQTACLPANVPTTGLVGYWPFCGNANDESGNANNGTNNGATLTADRFGNADSAYNFDGINDLISIPDSNTLGITNNITMSAWVFVNSDNQNYHSILSKRLNGNWSYNLSLSYYFGPGGSPTEVNKVFSGRRNNSGAQLEYKFSNEPVVFGQWLHITVKIENNVITFYKNGIDMGVNLYGNQFTIPMINQAIGLTIGSNGDGGEWFNGKLDDIGIWNRALTQEEITNLYNVNQCITNITVTDTLIINVGQLSFNDPVTWANNITIAPNPASSQININFNNITNLNGGTLKIINSLGQEVATTPITTSGTNSTMQLATWGGTGMYFVQIINPQGQIVDIKKIILQ